MRILYVSRSLGVHDRRFIGAWSSLGYEILGIHLDGDSEAVFSEKLGLAISKFHPDIVQAGPLLDIAHLVMNLWRGPLIAVSWAFDILQQAEQSLSSKQRIVQVLSTSEVLIVDSNEVLIKAIALGAVPESIVYFPWGVDEVFFNPPTLTYRLPGNWKKDSLIVLSNRNHEQNYGVSDIVEAFCQVAVNSRSIKLVVAGSGSLTDDFRKRIERDDLANQVHFTGFCSDKEMNSLYRQANLMISASASDGSSVSLLEAMATGVPVLASDSPGNLEWISEQTGSLFRTSSISEISFFLRQLLEGRGEFLQELYEKSRFAHELVNSSANWEANKVKLRQAADLALLRHKGNR